MSKFNLTLQQLQNVSKANAIIIAKKLLKAVAGPKAYSAQLQELSFMTFFMSGSNSKNQKTGATPQFYGHYSTCPKNCIFWLTGACYARNGHCAHWFAVANGKKVKVSKKNEYKTFAQPISELRSRVAGLPNGALYRINVAGDICYNNTGDINAAYLAELIDTFQNVKAYTYTHADKTSKNLKMLQVANAAGLTINASCETLEQVKKVMSANVPAVLAVEKMSAPVVKKDDITYIQCLAQTKGLTCKDCTICQHASRKCCVVFELHGTKTAVKKIKQAEILIKEL